MVRAKVEHPFRVIKRQFGHVKTRYRGLAKNRAQLFTLFALGNLFWSEEGCCHEGESVQKSPNRRSGGPEAAKSAIHSLFPGPTVIKLPSRRSRTRSSDVP